MSGRVAVCCGDVRMMLMFGVFKIHQGSVRVAQLLGETVFFREPQLNIVAFDKDIVEPQANC